MNSLSLILSILGGFIIGITAHSWEEEIILMGASVLIFLAGLSAGVE